MSPVEDHDRTVSSTGVTLSSVLSHMARASGGQLPLSGRISREGGANVNGVVLPSDGGWSAA